MKPHLSQPVSVSFRRQICLACCDLARVFGSVVDGARSQTFYRSRFAFRMPGSIPRPARYQGWVLEPGDALYLPPRLAHHGVSQDEVRTTPYTGGTVVFRWRIIDGM